MARKLADWLDAYLRYTKHSEPPVSYHLWTGISCIAAALERKVHIAWNMGDLYPNLYIILIGPSGKCRKGTAMRFGLDLLDQIKTINIASQSITKEAFLMELKNCNYSFLDPYYNRTESQSALTVASGELSVFLKASNIEFLAILTDLFDSHGKWTNKLKHGDSDYITGVCVNILGASAPDWLTSILPREAVGGGFTSRIIFVVEERQHKYIPFPEPTDEQISLQKKLVHDLQQIHLLKGRYFWAENTKEVMENWYIKQAKNPPFQSPALGGYCSRRATMVAKLCMVVAASQGDDMVIYPQDFLRAVKILETAETKMEKVFTGLGSARYSQLTQQALDILIQAGKNKGVAYSYILRTLYPDADDYTLKIALESLRAMKLVKTLTTGDETFFAWTGEGA